MQLFDLYTEYAFSTVPGLITLTGQYQIQSLLLARGYGELPANWIWVWEVQKGEHRGAFPRRVSSYFYKVHNRNVDADTLSLVGNLARQHSTEKATYRFEIVDRIDWQAGDYGDYNSCYWAEYAGGRLMLEQNGGMAIRFHDEKGQGYARAWMIETEDGVFIIFNGYGFSGGGAHATLRIAQIFSTFLGLPYKTIGLTRDGFSLYLNQPLNYAVGTPEALSGLEQYNIDWENIEVSVCHECGAMLDEYESYYGPDDHHYCEYCYSELFDRCEICDHDYERDDIYHVASAGKYGKYVCRYCRASNFDICEDCEDWYPKSDLIHTDDAVYCQNCYTPPETGESED